MNRCTTVALLIVAAAWGCRCGDRSGPVSARDKGQEQEWAASWSADDVPDREIGATLKGVALDSIHVQIHLEQDTTRIEILDRTPGDVCGHAADAQGFSVKLPGRIGAGDRMEKTMGEHPRGWSAFMVTRGDDGSAVSALAQGWSFALVVSSLDEDKAEIRGSMALSFDDVEHSSVVGRFSGNLCMEPAE
ncbi:MAG: hypothetical protein JRG91_20990 [Deltaproteobacteria bacterium]|nr:hypothetical protein [Deltaproteobacteria bacterium]